MPSKPTGPTVVLAYDGYSDADVKHRPKGAQWIQCDTQWVERVYLAKIAQKFMEESGQAEAGKQYQLDRLPQGYEIWERSRIDGKTWDRFCFGHPNHQMFNSPFDFYPHFKYLMEHDGEDGICECRFCKSSKSVRKATSSRSSSKPAGLRTKTLGIRGRPPLQRGPVDEEGNPDVITRLLTLLYKEGSIDRRLEERASMDWRVETVIYQGPKKELASQRSFVPRIGELVLFHRGVEGEVRMEPVSKEFKVWDKASDTYIDHPTWLAGVVTQVPIPSEPVHLEDITHETPKKHNVNSSGFRIECYPNPNDKDKNFSKQYTYVPMHHIRPMIFSDDILRGISVMDWHPTVQNAMRAMGSVSCVSRYKLKGTWPNVCMFCDGLFVGSELLWAGEPLRLMPRGKETAVIDVIVPRCFVVRADGLEPDRNGAVTPDRAKRMRLTVVGKIYTTDPTTSESRLPVTHPTTLPPAMPPYGPWYHKASPSDAYETSFTYILSRLYPYPALQLYFPSSLSPPSPSPITPQEALNAGSITPSEALNAGMQSTRSARMYATNDRVDKSGAHLGWFWSEDRACSLGLETFNGIVVGEGDMERGGEAGRWREVLGVLDGRGERGGVGETMPTTQPSSSSAAPANHRNPPTTPRPQHDDTEDELSKPMSQNVIDVDDYDDVIEELITGEGFPEQDAEGEGREAKRARMG